VHVGADIGLAIMLIDHLDFTAEERDLKQKGRLVGLPFLFLFVSWMQTYFSASRAAFIMVLK
jgi:hypothetical protein